jgi:GntR family transcriptional regulator
VKLFEFIVNFYQCAVFYGHFFQFPTVLWCFFFFPLTNRANRVLLYQALNTARQGDDTMGEQFDASRPIYAQLVERLKARILAGTYPPGGHLDSVRDLAAAAGVNPNTMQRALAQLETEGLVRTERTAGRYVTEDTALIEQLRADTARTLASDFLEKMRGIGYSPAQAAALLEHWDTKEDRNE